MPNSDLQSAEYSLEVRYVNREGILRDWHDASGYNNLTSTYTSMRPIKGQITRTKRWLERWYTDIQFRVLSRQVTRTEWKVESGV